MGVQAAELLFERISQPGLLPAQLKTECPLIVRDSTGKPSK
jgi:DNA-binding LacI/PurR family transcriptional regulator